MSKVIAFLGSPRKKGYSSQLAAQVIEGAKAAGSEVVVYHLNDEGIRGCQACFYCRRNEGCATKDKLAPMYADIREADGIIASFPIYYGQICGQSKIWLDRMYPMIGPKGPRCPGKKVITVYSQGSPDADVYKSVIDGNNRFFQFFGWELIDSLLACGTTSPGCTIPQELLDRAFSSGKQLLSGK